MDEFVDIECYCRRSDLFCHGLSLRRSMEGKKDSSLMTSGYFCKGQFSAA